MKYPVLFIQGGGEGGYEADKTLVKSLQEKLGNEYDIDYPEIQNDDSASDFGWIKQIDEKISEAKDSFILVGHSFGASMILKYLSENSSNKKIRGIFLLATPFWSGKEDWKQGLKLQENFADKLTDEIPIFLYHCEDDEEIPFSHLDYYKQKFTQATFRVIKSGGHQFNNDLGLLVSDIESLK